MRKNRIAMVICCVAAILVLILVPRVLALFQSSVPASQSASKSKGLVEKTKIEFTAGPGLGEIETSYGVHLGFTDIKASDGMKLSVFYLVEDDPVLASQVFNREIAKAVKVIKRDKKMDKTGKTVGERAEILTSSVKPLPPYSAVLWTDGATFHEILSRSLRHNIALEKVYKY